VWHIQQEKSTMVARAAWIIGVELSDRRRARAITMIGLMIACQLIVGCVATRQMPLSATRTGVITTGTRAPEFELNNDHGQRVRLSEFRGKWVVLYFYPEDETPSCTMQARDFTRLADEFDRMNAVVIGISPDPPYRHRLFRNDYGLKVILLSDPHAEVMRRYDAWHATTWRHQSVQRVVRSTYLINPQGMIAKLWPQAEPAGHVDRVISVLRDMQRNTR
jgi:peroxiredoxin Q/BCP